ncbi:ankyrin repeat domain-containing protein [Candidatus Mesenet endosymbiont of Phosphuga atrata]|uniref:ankyrin repeat domain-containing protein n=1 Tax=Candidatus Mesenet endosymbiont of Phosphuga atrata TaxID=3066221 RepID=UPI0030D2E24D
MIGSKETLETLNRILFGLVHSNSIEKTITILGLGLDINTQDDRGQTPIFLAALHNNLLMVEKLAELGADLETKDKLEDTILSKIVSKNNLYKKISKEEQLAMVKLLIKQGAKLTTRSHNALPIHRAIQARCSLNIIKILLTKETINEKNCPGRTPLHLAVLTRRADIAELLIKHGADIDTQEDGEQNTPLMLAVSKDYADLAIPLLVNGADPNQKNVYGQTFFDLANSEEMKSLALDVMRPLSTDTEFENKSIAQPSPSNNHSPVKRQVLENKPQSTRSILSDLKSIHNILPHPDLLIPSVYAISQSRMLDVSPPASEHSTSAILGSQKSSLSGSFTNQFQGALNIDSSSRSTISEISQSEGIISPGYSISGISQYEYTSSPGSGISAASRRRNISPPISNISESTRSSIDSFSPSGSHAVDTKRRRFSYTLL